MLVPFSGCSYPEVLPDAMVPYVMNVQGATTTPTGMSGLCGCGCAGGCGMSGLTMDGTGLFGTGIFAGGMDVSTWGAAEFGIAAIGAFMLYSTLRTSRHATEAVRKRVR